MTVSGRYVPCFQDATHALPEGMSMNADYPFMLPKIVERGDDTITIAGRGGALATAQIQKTPRGTEYVEIAQSSSFERLYGRRPTRFKLFPFKDDART